MTQEEIPSSTPRPKTKRKIVVSHTPLTDEASLNNAEFDDAALLHPSAVDYSPEPKFKPVQAGTIEAEVTSLQAKRGGGGFSLFFSVMALMGMMGLFYFILLPLQTETYQQAENLKKLQTDLSISQQRAAQLQDRVLAMAGRTDQGWILAEVQYLVHIAKARLVALQDVETAVDQLNTADERLKQLGDPALLTVREAISKNIAMLKAIKKPDRDSLALILNRLATEIKSLSLTQHLPVEKLNSMAVIENTVDLPLWQKALERSWQEIKSLIRVRHHDIDIVLPILSEGEAATLQQAVQLQIAQARLALLKENQILYQESLNTLKNWLTVYFEDTPARNKIVNEIDVASAVQITFEIPDLSETINMVTAALVKKDREAP